MNRRTEPRYPLTGESNQNDGQENFFFEIDDNSSIQGIPYNISLRGMGIIINAISSNEVEKLKNKKKFFVRLHLAGEVIIAGVRPVWKTVEFNEKGTLNFKAGCRIEIISPEDRIKLSSIIERIRSAG